MLGVAHNSLAASDAAYRGLKIVKARDINFNPSRCSDRIPDKRREFF
jgi:hypothetical protein